MTSQEPTPPSGVSMSPAAAALGIEAAIFASVGVLLLAYALLDFVYCGARMFSLETVRGAYGFYLDVVQALVELLLGLALTLGAPRLVRLWSRWTGAGV